MKIAWGYWLAVGLSLLLTCPLYAVGTAEEVLNQADAAYVGGDYARAESLLTQFIADFGTSKEIHLVLERVTSTLAFAQLRQKKYDAALENIEKYLAKYPEGKSVEELSFWQGLCLFKDGQAEKAIAALKKHCTQFPQTSKFLDAQMIIGAALLSDDKFKEAAAHFDQLAQRAPPALIGRARTFQLHALVQLADIPAALALVKSLETQARDFDTVAVYHLLTLQLGDLLREKEQTRDALYCFQRVWPKDRLIQRQEQRLALLEQDATRADQLKDAARSFQLQEITGQIRGELEKLRKLPDYDSALKLRVAECFYELERFREAALMLGEMIKRLPDGPLLEQAHYRLLTAFIEMERWDEAAISAENLVAHFPQSKLAPQALYLQGEAHQRRPDRPAAIASFQRFLEKYPEFPQADRATFLLAYNHLMLDQNDDAMKVFAEQLKKYPQSSLREQTVYWNAMALYFGKRYEEARAALTEYAKAYPKGLYQGEATFRRAYCLYAAKNYNDAYKELEAFLRDYKDHERSTEALVVLGDTYFALGEIERGIASFEKVPKDVPRFYEYSYFQIGKAYRLLEQPEKMLAHYQAFLKTNPKSTRVVEAMHWIAWVYRQDNKLDEAQKLYWQGLETYGNDPAAIAVEDMFSGLSKLYKGETERAQLLGKLRDLTETAQTKKQNTLAARTLWAQSLLSKKAEPERSRALLLQAGALVQPTEISPRLLADIGDAQRESGQADEASMTYNGILQWFPRALQKDRAYAGLGLLAAQQNKERAALDYFELFERETVQSPLQAQVLKAKANILLARRDYVGAIAEWEKVLKIPTAKGLAWVEALAQIGDCYMALNKPDKAVPYYQRIYIMYGRWTNYVAKAYFQSGQAFEKLNRRPEALNTYKEMVSKAELNQTEEFPKAKARLQALGEGTAS